MTPLRGSEGIHCRIQSALSNGRNTSAKVNEGRDLSAKLKKKNSKTFGSYPVACPSTSRLSKKSKKERRSKLLYSSSHCTCTKWADTNTEIVFP
jgi:hypothetical protein